MSQITQAGQLNATALVVPDLYVNIIPPQVANLNGVPTNVLGMVGTAQWGPVGVPVTVGNAAEFALNFGALQNRKYDLGTGVAAAILQGANNFQCVRVTDGTDVAATGTIKDTSATTGLTLTAKYTGTLGNSLQAIISAGSKASTFKIVLALPGQVPEVYDNIGGSGAAFWTNAAAAINSGQSPQRGPSQLCTATAGASVAAPALGSNTFSSGTDGATTITGSVLVGTDGAATARRGMYSLRGTGASVVVLVDCDDSTTWSTQEAYGLSEGSYMIAVGPAGQTISAAATAKSTAGIDNYAIKVLLGDWVWWNDPVNQIARVISPQGFVAGLLANLAPQESGLNKQVYGVVGTQSSANNLAYSSADLQSLVQAGIDLICNPCPGGAYFGVRIGHNSSSNAAVQGDNYTRMTNYLASTFAAGMGVFVGQLQSAQQNDPWRRGVSATLSNFLQNMMDQGQIDSFNVQCDLNNNPPSRIALGYGQADVTVKYLSVVEKFIVNLQGGQNVSVINTSNAAA
jgi:hypothetical protein